MMTVKNLNIGNLDSVVKVSAWGPHPGPGGPHEPGGPHRPGPRGILSNEEESLNTVKVLKLVA